MPEMSKITRLFKSRSKAKAWVDACVSKFPGRVTGGVAYAKDDSSYWAQIWGDITPEMAEEMRPVRGFFKYRQL